MRSEITAADIRQILLRSEVTTAFQPIWDLRQGRVFGFEALARFGSHGPSQWFRAARRSGLEVQLGRLACRRSLDDFSMLAEAHPQAFLFLNTSSPQSAVEIGRIALRSRYPSRVVIEVTEQLLAQSEDVGQLLDELRRGGLRIAVEATGVLLSRRRFLAASPEVLKLDRRAVMRLVGARDMGEGQVNEYETLARETGSCLLAAGIEQEEWLAPLTRMGVALAQGFALGRPAGAEELVSAGLARERMPEARRATPRHAELPRALGEAVRARLQEHAGRLVGTGDARHPGSLSAQLAAVLEEASRPGAMRCGAGPELRRRIAAMTATGGEIARDFSLFRRMMGTETAGLPPRVGLRLMHWLGGVEVALLRQRERSAAQGEESLLEEMARRGRHDQVMQYLLASLGEDGIGADVAKGAARLLGADALAIVFTSRGGRILEMRTYPFDAEEVRDATVAWLRHSPQALTSPQHRVLRRVRGPFSSYASTPVAFAGELWGLVVAWRREPIAFAHRDVEALDLLAGQVAMAMRAQQRIGEVLRREQELLAIEDVAVALRAAQDADEAARALIAGLQPMLGAQISFVTATGCGESPSVLTLAMQPTAVDASARQAITSTTRWVAGQGEPLFLREGALALEGEGAHLELGGFRSVAVAPVLAKGQVVGAVGALDRGDRRIDARFVETLERLAALLSLALARFEEPEILARR